MSLPHGRYESYEQAEAFYHELLARAAAIPGVQAVGAGTGLPLNGSASGCADVFVQGHLLQSGEEPPCVGMFIVAPGYFHTLGVQLYGREPTWSDVERHSGGIVVTKALADRLWPGRDALGKGINRDGSQPPYYHVVAVTDQIRGAAVARSPLEAVFYPMLPIPGTHLSDFPGTMSVVLHSHSARPEMLTAPLRRILADMDPNVPLANVQTMDTVVAKGTARLLFTMMLLGMAAAIALLLSAVGIYGVISYIVGRRTSEIGIRMALGAHAAHVGRLVVWQAVRLALVGILIGIVGSLMMTRVLQSLLFGISPNDPATLIGVSLIMLIAAIVASYVPAQRAMKINPVEALRAD
ncbi:MAG TPA: FtsX-like permease family protein [Gemmatimonadaceae bacterium]